MIVVHHLDRSRSHRILWLLEEIGLPYDIRFHKRQPSFGAPDSLKAVHPLGKSPVIEDDGIVIAETGAIIEHIVEKAGGLLGAPADPEGARHYRYFMHYAEGSLMPAIVTPLVMARNAPDSVPAYRAAALRHMDFVEAHLAHGPWFAGAQFGAADVMMTYPLEVAAARLDAGVDRPRIAHYLRAAIERPAFVRALEVGGDQSTMI